MNKSISQFLEIDEYKILQVYENEKELIIRLRPLKRRITCPNCCKSNLSRHANGTWKIKKHSHFQEKIIYLEVKRDRLKCLTCNHVFSQELPQIPKYARKTNNFVKQSLAYLSKNSFKEVEKVNKVGYGLLKNQLYDYVDPHRLLNEKIKALNKQKNIFLGFDGQSFRGTDMILTVTDIFKNNLITILPSETKKDLLIFLKNLSKNTRLKVKAIAMDMTNKHKKLLEQYFPNACIVTDKYHLIQYFIRQMQNTRKILQSARKVDIPIKKEMDTNIEDLTGKQQLKMLKYFMLYPKLREAYLFKEKIRSIYRVSKHSKVLRKFKILKNELLKSDNSYMKDLAKTMNNWETEILNYFKYRITNAYTEGIHTKCKLIKRKSFGFRNVNTYVRKLILGLIPLFSIFSIHTF